MSRGARPVPVPSLYKIEKEIIRSSEPKVEQKTVKEATPVTPSAKSFADVSKKLSTLLRESHRVALAEMLLRHPGQKPSLDDVFEEADPLRCPKGYENWSDYQRKHKKPGQIVTKVREVLEENGLLSE